MMKKENWSKAGNNNSLLQTARTKNFGAGKFGLLSLKSKPQPPIKKVKVRLSLPNKSRLTDAKHEDDISNVSDITILSSEEKDEIKINLPVVMKDFQKNWKSSDIDNEIESSVLDMSMKSENSLEFSLSKAFVPATTMPTNVVGGGIYTVKEGDAVQATLLSSLRPSTSVVNATQQQQTHNHFKSKKFAKSPKPLKNEVTITKKKTMDISKGLRFSAPAPMTLNRYQPQMGQEKTAPESKEYLEMQEMRKVHEQKQIEAKHMAEAKIVVEERLKQALESEEIRISLNINEEMNLATKNKKSLMKKILGKVRQKPSEKLQYNEKSTAIQAAMAAAAAAVEAATANPGRLHEGENAPISEEEARAIVSQALAMSRQKKNMNSVPAAMFHPSMINMDLNKIASQEMTSSVDKFGRSIIFPVNEVMMKRNEDSVSDLDASVKHVRRCPVSEIQMNDSKQYHGGESVSTLGTPRVFEQLDKLLLSESHRFQRQPSPVDELLEDNMVGSAAPPPMVTSHDAIALIDQADSGTMVGDMTAGTARVENAVKLCNIASNCFHPESKSLFMEASTRIHRLEEESSAYNDEDSFDDSESSVQEKSLTDGTRSSSNPALSKVIDDAIRKAEVQLISNHSGQQMKDKRAVISPREEVEERMSPDASHYRSEVTGREKKYPSSSHAISPSSKRETLSQHDQQTTDFDSFMKIAAAKLDKDSENDSKFDQRQRDSYSTEIEHNLRERSRKNRRSGSGKIINDTSPKIQEGGQKHLFGQESQKHHFSDQQYDLLPAENSNRNSVYDLKRLDKHLQIDDHNHKNLSRRTRSNGKSRMRVTGTHKDGTLTNQGRFLLEKDDAYWDTLSTIASTANDRSTESDEYMDEFVQPGPIPGEITTSSSEMKSVATPVEAQNMNLVSTKDGTSSGEQTRSEENLHEMLNDVTDLIDADLLDILPPSKNRRSKDQFLKFEEQSGVKPSTSTGKMAMISSQMRPVSETVDRSKLEENKSGSFAMASQIVKGIRSVSWGFEEIYEDKNPHMELSDQDTDNSESSFDVTRKPQPFPEGMRSAQYRSLYSTEEEMGEDEDLLSRTLELSRGLLQTIMGSQIVQENNDDEEVRRQYEGSDNSREVKYDEIHRNEKPVHSECRDDDSHQEGKIISETNEKYLSPKIQSRLESLRNQRAMALSKFRESQKPASRSKMTEPMKRDRDRLKHYAYGHSYGKLLSKRKQSIVNESYSDDSDIELNYTTSDSNASTTPSQKARDLRVQLNEAMRASREIQISQNQLENELYSFKRKYYKNPEIEHYATNARVSGF